LRKRTGTPRHVENRPLVRNGRSVSIPKCLRTIDTSRIPQYVLWYHDGRRRFYVRHTAGSVHGRAVGGGKDGGNKPASLITSAVCFTYDVPIGRQSELVASLSHGPLRVSPGQLFPSSFFIYSRFFSPHSFPYTPTPPHDLSTESPLAATFTILYTIYAIDDS